jgi:hypothetical protein
MRFGRASATPRGRRNGYATRPGWSSIRLTHSGCAFTVTITWAGVILSDHNDAANVWVVQNDGPQIAPASLDLAFCAI